MPLWGRNVKELGPLGAGNQGGRVVSDGTEYAEQRHMLSRRRFMQLGAGAAMLPLVLEGTAGAAGAAEQRLTKVKANPKAILQFGQMQGESYDPIRQVGVEYIQLYALFDMLLSYTERGPTV